MIKSSNSKNFVDFSKFFAKFFFKFPNFRIIIIGENWVISTLCSLKLYWYLTNWKLWLSAKIFLVPNAINSVCIYSFHTQFGHKCSRHSFFTYHQGFCCFGYFKLLCFKFLNFLRCVYNIVIYNWLFSLRNSNFQHGNCNPEVLCFFLPPTDCQNIWFVSWNFICLRKVFSDSRFIIYEWLCLVWILPAIILLILVFNNCKYNFKKAPSNFVLNCQPWGSIVDLPPPRWIQIVSNY